MSRDGSVPFTQAVLDLGCRVWITQDREAGKDYLRALRWLESCGVDPREYTYRRYGGTDVGQTLVKNK